MIWFFRPQGFDCVNGHQVHCVYLHVCLQRSLSWHMPWLHFFSDSEPLEKLLTWSKRVKYTIISLLFYHFIKKVLRLTLISKTFLINIKKKTSKTFIISIKKRLHQYISLLSFYFYFHLMLQLISSKKPH